MYLGWFQKTFKTRCFCNTRAFSPIYSIYHPFLGAIPSKRNKVKLYPCRREEEMSPFSLFVLNCLSSSTLLNVIVTALTFPVKAQIGQCLAWHFVPSISSDHFPSTWVGGVSWDVYAFTPQGVKESPSSSLHMYILLVAEALCLAFFNYSMFPMSFNILCLTLKALYRPLGWMIKQDKNITMYWWWCDVMVGVVMKIV